MDTTMQDTVTVGLVGAGTMGSRMLTRLAERGYSVVARDIAPEAERRAAQAGAAIARSPAEVARRAPTILLSLPMPADVEAVVTAGEGVLDGARPGSVIVDLSTIDPDTTRRCAQHAGDQGVGYLDAPVLGRPPGVGKWTLPVGGESRDLERVRPVLEALAARVVHVGPSGSGHIVKLLNNLMFAAINATTTEVLAICEGVGLDPQVFFNTVVDSGAATVSNLFRELGPKILARDFAPAFSLTLLRKDVRLGAEMASRAMVPTVIAPACGVLIEMALAGGMGAEDTGALVKVFEGLSSREVRPHTAPGPAG
jgi:3-hydroxyisobutyrate dehydrogenase-like beta-hydroxyacid dehydrogenase